MVSLVLVALVFGFMVVKWGWEWTGVVEYTTKRTTETTNGNIKTTEEIQRSKTLWDWLQLAGAVAIPLVLFFGGNWLNEQEKKRIEKREQREKERAEADLREAALQAYFDRMSELLTNKDLGNQVWKENPARVVARAITLAMLRSLSKGRHLRSTILEFLYEADLIRGDSPIISLRRANLMGVYLYGVSLMEANLRQTDLRGAGLDWANLEAVNLYGANLHEAGLRETNLKRANLEKAFLGGAILEKANLEGANLMGTFLRVVKLQGANLRGANLQEAKLERANLVAAKYDNSTIFPDGFDPEKAGMLKIDDSPEGSVAKSGS